MEISNWYTAQTRRGHHDLLLYPSVTRRYKSVELTLCGQLEGKYQSAEVDIDHLCTQITKSITI